MGSAHSIGDWLEKQRALSSSGHNLEGALLAGEAARTPSKHCCSALDQGTIPLNAHIGPCDWFGECPYLYLHVAGIGSNTLPENPKGKTAIKKKINEVCVESIQPWLNFLLILMVNPNVKIFFVSSF